MAISTGEINFLDSFSSEFELGCHPVSRSQYKVGPEHLTICKISFNIGRPASTNVAALDGCYAIHTDEGSLTITLNDLSFFNWLNSKA